LTDASFKRGDVVTLQDPAHPEKFDVSSFHHIRHNLMVTDEGGHKTDCACICITRTGAVENREATLKLPWPMKK